MPEPLKKYGTKGYLYVSKPFIFGQVFWVNDILISIPDADRVAFERTIHDKRLVVVLGNNSQNTNRLCPIITIAPLSHRKDLKRKFDVILCPDKDRVKEESIVQMQLMQPICKIDLGGCLGFVSNEKQAELMDSYLEMVDHECET